MCCDDNTDEFDLIKGINGENTTGQDIDLIGMNLSLRQVVVSQQMAKPGIIQPNVSFLPFG